MIRCRYARPVDRRSGRQTAVRPWCAAGSSRAAEFTGPRAIDGAIVTPAYQPTGVRLQRARRRDTTDYSDYPRCGSIVDVVEDRRIVGGFDIRGHVDFAGL